MGLSFDNSLAFDMMLKFMLRDLPYQGAKGGVCYDPKENVVI